jgi:hypothetical protein
MVEIFTTASALIFIAIAAIISTVDTDIAMDTVIVMDIHY